MPARGKGFRNRRGNTRSARADLHCPSQSQTLLTLMSMRRYEHSALHGMIGPVAHENARRALWNVPGGMVTVQQGFDPEARVAGSIHNFWEDTGPACGADVDGAYRAVQHADAIVWNVPLARVTLPPLIRCRLFIDAPKSVAAFTVYVKCHLTVSLDDQKCSKTDAAAARARVPRHGHRSAGIMQPCQAPAAA
jgi:hypothetical protein